jgi:hypothetical protein
MTGQDYWMRWIEKRYCPLYFALIHDSTGGKCRNGKEYNFTEGVFLSRCTSIDVRYKYHNRLILSILENPEGHKKSVQLFSRTHQNKTKNQL